MSSGGHWKPGWSSPSPWSKPVGYGIWGREAATPSPSCLPSSAKVSAGRGRRKLRTEGRRDWQGEGAHRKRTLGGRGAMQMAESASPSAINTSSTGSSWDDRSRGAGWLSSRRKAAPGKSTAAHTKGTSAPQRKQPWGTSKQGQKPSKVWVEATEGPEHLGPCPWDSRGPSCFVPASESPNAQSGHLRYPTPPAVLARGRRTPCS